MKRINEKTIRVILFIIVIAIIIIFAIKIKTKKDKEIPYAERENAAVEEAKSYINGKYGDVLTYSGVKEMTTSMINGEAYWMVYFTNIEGETFSVQVFYDDGAMYIEYETYYGYYIKDIMCEWMEEQLEQTDLKEYSLEYVIGKEFATDWELDSTPEEILSLANGRNGYVYFRIRIPERERDIYDSGRLVEKISYLSSYIKEKSLVISLVIYDDDIYDSNYENFYDNEQYIPMLEQIILE